MIQKRQVLIIDDDKRFCEQLDQKLSKAGYKVQTVSSGYDAIQVLQDFKPDFCILNLIIPITEGFTIHNFISKNEKLAKSKIYYLTYFLDEEDLRWIFKQLEYDQDQIIIKSSSNPEATIDFIHSKLSGQAAPQANELVMEQGNEDLHMHSRKLLEYIRWYQSIINSLNIGIMVSDKSLRINYINSVAEKLLKIDAEDWLGKQITELELLSAQKELKRNLDIISAPTYTEPILFKVPYGNYMIEVTMSRVEADEELVGFSIALREYTFRKEENVLVNVFLENLLKQSNDAINDIKNTFDIILSQDPDLWKKIYLPVSNLVDQLEIYNTDMMNTLTNLKEKFKLNWDILHLEKLIYRTIRGLEGMAEKLNLTFTPNIDKELKPILGDEQLVILVLFNLMRNALRYSKPLSTIQVNAHNMDDFVYLGIRHEGEALTDEELQNIFNLSSDIDYITQGQTLSLKTVDNILRLHRAQLKVNSEPEQWTEFYFEIPMLKYPQFARMEAGDSERYRNKFIVVEDDPIVRLQLEKMATELDLVPISVESPQKLLEYANHFKEASYYLNILSKNIDLREVIPKMLADKKSGEIIVSSLINLTEDQDGEFSLGLENYIFLDNLDRIRQEFDEMLVELFKDFGDLDILLLAEDDQIKQTLNEICEEKVITLRLTSDMRHAIEQMLARQPDLFLVSLDQIRENNRYEVIKLLKDNTVTADIHIIAIMPPMLKPMPSRLVFQRMDKSLLSQVSGFKFINEIKEHLKKEVK